MSYLDLSLRDLYQLRGEAQIQVLALTNQLTRAQRVLDNLNARIRERRKRRHRR